MEDLKKRRALLSKADLFLIGVVLIVLVIVLFFTYSRDTGKMYAVITVDGRVINKIDLKCVTEPYTIEISGDYPCEILIEKDAVSIVSASCPDKLCKNAGRLTKVGMQAVCLPNRLSVRIEGQGTQNSLDAVTE